MLLQAIPEAIRTEVLANRLQTTLAILARIMTMTIYRPGSAVERQQVLKALESRAMRRRLWSLWWSAFASGHGGL